MEKELQALLNEYLNVEARGISKEKLDKLMGNIDSLSGEKISKKQVVKTLYEESLNKLMAEELNQYGYKIILEEKLGGYNIKLVKKE